MKSRHLAYSAVLLLSSPLAGCTFEAGIVDIFTDDPTPIPPVEAIPGAVSVMVEDGITAPDAFYIYDVYGNEIPMSASLTPDNGYYTLTAEDASQLIGSPLRVVATSGHRVLKRVIPCLLQADLDAGVQVDMSISTTAEALTVEALGNFSNGDLASVRLSQYLLSIYASDEIQVVMDAVQADIAAGAGYGSDLARMVAALLEASDASDQAIFPLAVSSLTLVNDDFLSGDSVDYTGDGNPDSSGDEFELAAYSAADEALPVLGALSLAQYTDPESGTKYDYLPVVFTAAFETGCAPPVCGDWIVCDAGDRLFFVGGVHKESAVQDPALSEQMGSWTPNTIPMYDDGTHGDLVAGDSIWTISFLLPEGLKIGYKYTYGTVGQLWTGTEEWPGNQRILEIVDNNSDGIVWRDDKVGDEESNKDKNNCHESFGGCNGIIDFTTDLNDDGYPEAQEYPIGYTVLQEGSNVVSLSGGCPDTSAGLRYPTITRSTVGQCK